MILFQSRNFIKPSSAIAAKAFITDGPGSLSSFSDAPGSRAETATTRVCCSILSIFLGGSSSVRWILAFMSAATSVYASK